MCGESAGRWRGARAGESEVRNRSRGGARAGKSEVRNRSGGGGRAGYGSARVCGMDAACSLPTLRVSLCVFASSREANRVEGHAVAVGRVCLTPHPRPLSPSRGEGCYDAFTAQETDNSRGLPVTRGGGVWGGSGWKARATETQQVGWGEPGTAVPGCAAWMPSVHFRLFAFLFAFSREANRVEGHAVAMGRVCLTPHPRPLSPARGEGCYDAFTAQGTDDSCGLPVTRGGGVPGWARAGKPELRKRSGVGARARKPELRNRSGWGARAGKPELRKRSRGWRGARAGKPEGRWYALNAGVSG